MMKNNQFSLGHLFIYTAVLSTFLSPAVAFPSATAEFAHSTEDSNR